MERSRAGSRVLALVLISVALAGCTGSTASRQSVGAPDLDAKRQEAKDQTAKRGDVDARSVKLPPGASSASMKLFNKTVIYVKDAYYDPKRIDPRRMLVGALQAVGRATPQLEMNLEDPARIRLASGGVERTFDISSVDSVWKMSFAFSDIYTQLVGPLGIPDDSRRIGFAATNGMLGTLDPFSAIVPEAIVRRASQMLPAASPSVSSAAGISRTLGMGVGYVRLRSLPPKASRDLELALEDIRQKLGETPQGLVLDLRANHGGLLEQAVRVVSVFVDDGIVFKTVSLGGRNVEEKRATKSAMVPRTPLAVLVDDHTGAGAEAIAGALKDLGRALVIGQRTAGAGTIQVIYEFGDVDGLGKTYLHLTIAEMLRSTGTPIDRLGITPDLLVRLDPSGEDTAPSNPTSLLTSRRLESNERPVVEISRSRPSSPAAIEDRLLEDPEIQVARDLLVGARSGGRNDLLAGAKALPR